MRLFRYQPFQIFKQRWNILFCRVPHPPGVYQAVLMRQYVSLADDLAPRYLGMGCLQFGRDVSCCLTKQFEGSFYGETKH